jgi:hypothetical protein
MVREDICGGIELYRNKSAAEMERRWKVAVVRTMEWVRLE